MTDKVTPVTEEDEVLREFGDNLVRTEEGVLAGFEAKKRSSKFRHQSGSMVAASDFKAGVQHVLLPQLISRFADAAGEDKVLTRDEFEVAFESTPHFVEKIWFLLDADADGTVTLRFVMCAAGGSACVCERGKGAGGARFRQASK